MLSNCKSPLPLLVCILCIISISLRGQVTKPQKKAGSNTISGDTTKPKTGTTKLNTTKANVNIANTGTQKHSLPAEDGDVNAVYDTLVLGSFICTQTYRYAVLKKGRFYYLSVETAGTDMIGKGEGAYYAFDDDITTTDLVKFIRSKIASRASCGDDYLSMQAEKIKADFSRQLARLNTANAAPANNPESAANGGKGGKKATGDKRKPVNNDAIPQKTLAVAEDNKSDNADVQQAEKKKSVDSTHPADDNNDSAEKNTSTQAGAIKLDSIAHAADSVAHVKDSILHGADSVAHVKDTIAKRLKIAAKKDSTALDKLVKKQTAGGKLDSVKLKTAQSAAAASDAAAKNAIAEYGAAAMDADSAKDEANKADSTAKAAEKAASSIKDENGNVEKDTNGGESTTKAAQPEVIESFDFLCDSDKWRVYIIKKDKSYNLWVGDSSTKLTDVTEDEYFLLGDKINLTDVQKFITQKVGDDGGCTEDYLNSQAQKVHDKVEGDQVQAAVSSQKKEYETLLEKIDDSTKRVAGEIRVLKKKIPLYYNKGRHSPGDLIPMKEYYLTVDTVFIQIDYNRLSTLTLVEPILHQFDNSGNETTYALPSVSNNDYSLTFGGLNDQEYSQQIPFHIKQKQELSHEGEKMKIIQYQDGDSENDDEPWIKMADFVHYKPSGGDFSTIVKNDHFSIPADSTHKLYRRTFSDYLSFRTFLDPLGFLGKNANGFAQLEGDVLVPMRVRSRGRTTWFAQSNFNFSYIYSNSVNQEPRIVPVIPLLTYYSSTDAPTAYYLHNIDLIKYRYYMLYGRFAVFTREAKRLNTWVHFELGTRVTGARVFKDSTASPNATTLVHKIIPEFNLRFDIRPDGILGATVNIGMDLLANDHKGNNSPSNINDPAFLYRTSLAFPHEINIYANTSADGKGGLFFRYLGWLAVDKELSQGIIKSQPGVIGSNLSKTSYFPEIMLGYSTNLSTLVKRGNQ